MEGGEKSFSGRHSHLIKVSEKLTGTEQVEFIEAAAGEKEEKGKIVFHSDLHNFLRLNKHVQLIIYYSFRLVFIMNWSGPGEREHKA